MSDKATRKIKRSLRKDQCPTCGGEITSEQARALRRGLRREGSSAPAPSEPASIRHTTECVESGRAETCDGACAFAYRPRTFSDGND